LAIDDFRIVRYCPSSSLPLEFRPSRIHCWSATTRAKVQVGTASRTKALAILATEGEPRRREQPLFPQRRTEIDRRGPRFQHVHIRVVRLLVSRIGEQQVKLLVDARTRWCEATTAIFGDFPRHSPAEVKPLLTGTGESACDHHAVDGPWIPVEPDRIVGGQLSINPSGLRFEGRSVEGVHRKPHNLETQLKWVKSL
jgi:hypothetical protein